MKNTWVTPTSLLSTSALANRRPRKRHFEFLFCCWFVREVFEFGRGKSPSGEWTYLRTGVLWWDTVRPPTTLSPPTLISSVISPLLGFFAVEISPEDSACVRSKGKSSTNLHKIPTRSWKLILINFVDHFSSSDFFNLNLQLSNHVFPYLPFIMFILVYYRVVSGILFSSNRCW